MALLQALRTPCALLAPSRLTGSKISTRIPPRVVGTALSSSRRAFAQAEVSPSVRNLAGGWQAIYSAEHAREYYWNTQSGTTTWEPPSLPSVASDVTESSTENTGKKRRAGHRGGKNSPNSKMKQALADLMSSALKEPVSKDEFVLKHENFGQLSRCTLTVARLENQQFQGAADSAAEASQNAVALATCHVREKFGIKEDSDALKKRRSDPEESGAGTSGTRRRSDGQCSKNRLASLVQHAYGRDLKQGEIPYSSQQLGDIIEATVSIPMLEDPALSKEFKGSAKLETGEEREKVRKTKEAEWAAASAALEALQPSLTATGDARKATSLDTPPHSDSNPRPRLKQLVRYALGAHPGRGDIVYTSQAAGETMECTLTLPVLKDGEPTEFKATAASAKEAEEAAALAAFQALESTLMAKAGARIAEKKVE